MGGRQATLGCLAAGGREDPLRGAARWCHRGRGVAQGCSVPFVRIAQVKEECPATAGKAGRRVPLRLAFYTDGLDLAVSGVNGGGLSRLGLTVSLQTFLTALTWICPSNNARGEGWLIVTLCENKTLCWVQRDAGDSSSLRLVPITGRMPPVLRGAIQALNGKRPVDRSGYDGEKAW